MANSKLRLDSAGIAEVLNSAAVTAETTSLGNAVKSAASGETASGESIHVTTRMRTASGGRLKGSRPAVDITLAHPAGMAVEAKRGTLVRAAAAAGLQVKAR